MLTCRCLQMFVCVGSILAQRFLTVAAGFPDQDPSDPQAAPLEKEPRAQEPKVTITKVFDFAGEEVR